MMKQPLKGSRKVEQVSKRRLFVEVGGLQKQGKTHFLFSAPGPIAYFDFNNRSDYVADKFCDEKEIHMYEYGRTKGMEMSVWRAVWDEFVTDFKAAVAHPEIRTIGIDTDTDLWEIRRIAQFGRASSVPTAYSALNKDLRDLFNMVRHTDKNLVVLTEMKKKYVTRIVRTPKGEHEQASWDGTYEMVGWSGTPYKVDMVCSTSYDVAEKEFVLNIINSGIQPGLAGEEYSGIDCSFPIVAMDVFPDTTLEYWDYESNPYIEIKGADRE